MKRLLAALIINCISCTGLAAQPFPVSIRGMDIDLPLFSLFALPGEALSIRYPGAGSEGLEAVLNENRTGQVGDSEWRFRAPPRPGIYAIRLTHAPSRRQTRLNLLVMQPATEVKKQHLNGYRIDDYPPPRAKTPELYQPPRGFIEVSEANRKLQLTPHFTLEQFLCKQKSGFPKYLALHERLLALLERIVPMLHTEGFPVTTLSPISGYRTPYYNRLIGNVPNSRHVFGDAYDWYVDVDGDGRMDDINGDGQLDGGDSRALFKLVNAFLDRPENKAFVGGLGRYRPTASHGGFVHVDTRGYRARW